MYLYKEALAPCGALWKFVSFVPQCNNKSEYVNIMENFDLKAYFSFNTHKVGISIIIKWLYATTL